MTFRLPLAELPTVPRWILLVGVSAGAIGAVVGLVLGLTANPPTAWFAVFEIGIPAGFVGCLLGIVIGTVIVAARRVLRTNS